VPFEIKTGSPLAAGVHETYTGFFGKKLVELAGRNKNIVAITAAMPEGTGLDRFRDLFPERFFDVGIAEGHAVCFAGGLCSAGLRPLVAVYSTFLQRAFDQIIEDVALQRHGVVFAIDRAGIVGEDGMTHQGIFDLAYLRCIPNMVVASPKDGPELERMLEIAFAQNMPFAVRYPKSTCPTLGPADTGLSVGKAEVLGEGKDFCFIALGSMVAPALEAVESLKKEGIRGTLVNARFVKPLDTGLLKRATSEAQFVFTAEEGVLEGGFGSAVSEALQRPTKMFGLPSAFIPHAKRDFILEQFGLTAAAMAAEIKRTLWAK